MFIIDSNDANLYTLGVLSLCTFCVQTCKQTIVIGDETKFEIWKVCTEMEAVRGVEEDVWQTTKYSWHFYVQTSTKQL